MKRLLLIDNSTGDGYNAIGQIPPARLPLPCDAVNLFAGDPVPSLEGYTHILSTGCPKGVHDAEPWMDDLSALFREALSCDLPLLAICFSHQLLAKTIAGAQYVRRRPSPELGWVRQELLEDDLLLGPKGSSLWGFAFHFDEVTPDLPKDKARILMRSDTCEVEAFRVVGKKAWGLQAHFEETIQSGLAMLDRNPSLAPFVQNRDTPKDSGVWNPLLERFCAL